MVKLARRLIFLIRIKVTKLYYQLKFGKRLKIQGYIIAGKGFELKLGEGALLELEGGLYVRHYCSVDLGKGAHVKIGKRCFFNSFSSIVVHSSMEIGDDVICGESVKFYDNDHLMEGTVIHKNKFLTSPITIGPNVWIANNVNVLRGSIVQANTVIGAMSLVKSELQGNAVYAGIPVKKIKDLEE